MDKPFQFINLDQDAKIPLPSLEYAQKEIASVKSSTTPKRKAELTKYEKAYDAYCKWVATPTSLRNPKTVDGFEKRWGIPSNYSATFRHREDYLSRFKTHLWNWIRDKYSDFAESMYRKAVKDGNPSAIKFFAEIIAKDLEVEKPKAKIQPFVFIGVDQSKIDRLFQPDGTDKVEDLIIGEEK